MPQQHLQKPQLEIEAKLFLEDFELLLLKSKLLKDLSGGDVYKEKNFVYKCPQMRAGEFLRIRQEELTVNKCGRLHHGGRWTLLTYKGKNTGRALNVRDEVELEISLGQRSNATLEELLAVLGFSFYSSYAKERQVYNFKNPECDVFLDAVWQIPNGARQQYIEVEGQSERDVLAILERLGLAGKPIIRESYADIFAEVKNGTDVRK
ncbi:MAG: CYTH domain-containing protein [DPANN group archaeon]|nr:CYTH domain-containing protein [DPANN group archaeon]